MMRAMRTTLAFCVLLLGVAGCGNDSNSSGPDMSMPLDMTLPPDMSLNGVTCGSMTCTVGQDCCVTVGAGNVPSSTCIASGGSCTGGATLACDGPEDCTSSPFCCGTIAFTGGLDPDAGAPMFNGGNSSCNATCAFNLNQGPPEQITTRLCHFDADCAGLTGFGTSLNKCCSSTMAPGLHFCALAIGGITCP
jgi:hypothetical protein